MRYVEPHAHMVSRTTDDYMKLVQAGCEAVCEPAFWAGFDRSSVKGFFDYFSQLTKYEPARAAKFGLPHFCWICLNPKESEDIKLAEDVLEIIPDFLDSPTCLGVGEIGLNKNSKNELEILERHIEIAAQRDELILVHTPHLEDKLKGTKLIVDAILNQPSIRPERVIIDHVEEHTISIPRDKGFWVGMTLYPESKCSPQRAADMLEVHGTERIWMNSACDWGISNPLAVPEAAFELRRRGQTREMIDKVLYQNPRAFLSQSPKFTL